MENMITFKDVVRLYPSSRRALSIAHLAVAEGEFTAILGSASSGKTTLIRLICGMELPDSGTVTVMGQETGRMADQQRAAFRNTHMGIVLKESAVMEEFSAAENTALPLMARGMDKMSALIKAKNFLKAFGLKEHMNDRAGGLTAYERRMVSLARASLGQPFIILLDEPEADLNGKEKEGLLESLQVIANSGCCTIVCATNDEIFASVFKRILHLRDGSFLEE